MQRHEMIQALGQLGLKGMAGALTTPSPRVCSATARPWRCCLTC